MMSCLQDILVQKWHQVCESNQAISDLGYGPVLEMESIPNAA